MRTIDIEALARAIDERAEYLIDRTGRQSEGGEEIVWFAVEHSIKVGSRYDVRTVFDRAAVQFRPSGDIVGAFIPDGCNCKWSATHPRYHCKHSCLLMITMGTIHRELIEQAQRITKR